MERTGLSAACALKSRDHTSTIPRIPRIVFLALRGTYLKCLFSGVSQSCFLSVKRIAVPGESPVLWKKLVILHYSAISREVVCWQEGLFPEASMTGWDAHMQRS